MNPTPRLLAATAALLVAAACSFAQSTPTTSSTRVDDDVTFSDWFTVTRSATDPDLYEVDLARTLAPEKLREVRIWVDTAGLFRFDDGADDGDTVAGKDYISFEDFRKQEVFKGQTKYMATTSFENPDSGELIVFREYDAEGEFNRMKSAMLDGKFKLRVSASSPGEYTLRRVHVTVHFKHKKR
jgi:hypothetical protein